MTPSFDSSFGQTVEERLRYETFLSELAARFLNLSPDTVVGELDRALEGLVEALDVDRSSISVFTPDSTGLPVTHTYARPGVPRQELVDIAPRLPWYAQQVRRGKTLVLPRLPESFPAEATAERTHVSRIGMKSHVCLPLRAGGKVHGALGVGSFRVYRDFTPAFVLRLELLAGILANALYRRRAQQRLQEAHELNRSVLASVSAEIVVIDAAGRIVAVNEAWTRSLRRRQHPQSTFRAGVDYVEEIERAAGDDPRGKEIAGGIRSVLSREKDRFENGYAYAAAGESRFYQVAVTPLSSDGGGAVVVYTDITELEEAKLALEKSLEEVRELKERLEAENILLQEQVHSVRGFDEVIGTSDALGRVLAQVEQVAPTETPVLILGETGTGKELIARAIHNRSNRRERSFVTVNCAALPATLVESEVFGYEKGAFTGAHQRTLGRFEVAHGGTLLLDEIGELALEVQAKLLRVLEKGELERLGSTKTIKVDVRLIAATNRDLEREVREDRFRADLFYRLNVFPIALPPLRERPEDIPVLVWHFITRKQGDLGKRIKRVPDRLMNAYTTYSWPGNVRELANVIERSLIMTSGATLATDPLFRQGAPSSPASSGTTLAAMERAHILAVLKECGWKISGKGNAADRLGLKRSTLQFRMAKLGIHRPVRGS